MGSLLFSPSGRIGPSQFMSGVLVLVILGLIINLAPVFVPALALLGFLGIVFLWCWIVLWVKRYHDAGQSGWMCILPIIVFMLASSAAGVIAAIIILKPEGGVSSDFATSIMSAGAEGLPRTASIIIMVVNAAISYLIAMFFNKIIARDGDNRFGPAAGAN